MKNLDRQENREELLELAVDLLRDVMLLDCLLERLEAAGWEGDSLDTLTTRLHSYIQTHCRDIQRCSRVSHGTGLPLVLPKLLGRRPAGDDIVL